MNLQYRLRAEDIILMHDTIKDEGFTLYDLALIHKYDDDNPTAALMDYIQAHPAPGVRNRINYAIYNVRAKLYAWKQRQQQWKQQLKSP